MSASPILAGFDHLYWCRPSSCYCCCCCHSFEACCDWLRSILLALYIPLAASPGSSTDRGFSNDDNQQQQLQQQSGIGGGTAGGGGRRRWGFGGADGVTGGGDGDRGSIRRVTLVDDGKPLLSKSASMEFREKEKRFIKGRFVMPGSDVQRKIADAMASVLAAGGKAMSGSDSSSSVSSWSNIGGGHESTSSRRNSDDIDSYKQVPEKEQNTVGAIPVGEKGVDGTDGDSSSVRNSSRKGGGFLFRRASPRKIISPSDTRECVICMDDFTTENPEMLTLCSCGMNKTFFHYACLLKWLSKHSYCPACRGHLYFEERHRNPEERSGNVTGGRRWVSNEEYGKALQRALRVGLSAASEGVGGAVEGEEEAVESKPETES